MYSSEYARIRKNLMSVLSRARRDGVEVSDINIPNIPKRITEGSVRRIKKIHEEAKHEIAKRRRIKRYKQAKQAKEILPKRKSRAVLDNLRYIVEQAMIYTDNVHGRGYSDYEEAVRTCGTVANDLIEEMLTENETEAMTKFPGHSDEFYEIIAENAMVDAAEEILRNRQQQLDYFLYGFSSKTGGMPDSDPKPIYYAVLRSIMGKPLSGDEYEKLITGPFELEEPFSEGEEI